MNTKLRTSLLALGAAALLVPTGATAKSDKAAGKGPKAKSEHTSKGKAKGHAKSKNAVLIGEVTAVDAAGETVTLTVEKANRWGRHLKGDSVLLAVGDVKKLGVRDVNGDLVKDLNDVVAGDKAHAQARITKDQESDISARKFKVKYPESETEEEQEEVPAS